MLSGIRFGNAFSEKNSKTVAAFETTFKIEGDTAVVNGEKFYTTGALLAHIVPIVAVSPEGQGFLAFAERDAPGLTVINDWSSFGQRTTASGSIKIENVRVPVSRLVPVAAFDRPTAAGAISQIIQSAIDATRNGAYHYLTKPFDTDELLVTMQKAVENPTFACS